MQASLRWLSVSWVRASLVVLCVFAVDQLTKSAVNGSILPGTHHQLVHGLELVNVHDDEFVMGVIPIGPSLRMVIGVLGLLIAAGAFFRSLGWQASSTRLWLPVGLMLGGGLGNIFDLVSQGSATDFIELSPGKLAFNLADAAVLLGMLAMALSRMLGMLPSSAAARQAATGG